MEDLYEKQLGYIWIPGFQYLGGCLSLGLENPARRGNARGGAEKPSVRSRAARQKARNEGCSAKCKRYAHSTGLSV